MTLIKEGKGSPVQVECSGCKGRKLLLIEVLGIGFKLYCTHCGSMCYMYLPIAGHEDIAKEQIKELNK